MRPELLLSTDASSVPRYRRRILAVGTLIAIVVAAFGAPVYLGGIERDLERRVPEELVAAGVPEVRAAFSGQEGVLHCDAPLADPEGVLDLANAVHGVVLVDLDRSCRVSSAPIDGSLGAAPGPDGPPEPDDPAPPTSVATFDTVGELVRSSPRFSILASMLVEADAADLFDDRGITVLAPTNDAFEVLPADVLAELRTRPDLLREVLANHVIDDDVRLADLARLADGAGDRADAITTRAGTELVATRGDGRGDGAILVGEAVVVDGDLLVAEGLVHVVDRPLLPAGLDVRALAGLPEFAAVLRAGQLELTGSVPSAAERARIIAAAATAIDRVNVSHEIDVDPAARLRAAEVDRLVAVLAVAPTSLVSGSIGFDGNDLFVRGTVVDDDAREALAMPEVRLELEPRPVAEASDVVEVNAALAGVLGATPLAFAPASAELDPSAAAILDVVAAIVKSFDRMTVVVEGHTDTAGDPQVNLALSELRAAVVHLELAARGVPGDQLDHVGRGAAVPIVVDGVEDPVASRRVELVASSAG